MRGSTDELPVCECALIVGIITFISMIKTTSKSLKARKVFIFQYFSFYEQLKEVRALRGKIGSLFSQKTESCFLRKSPNWFIRSIAEV